jgi:hypothetical protein
MSVNEILQSVYELPLEERKELLKMISENIQDENLQCDPYFYERKKHLHQIRDDIKSGKVKMIPHDEFWGEMEQFTQELEIKYADKL